MQRRAAVEIRATRVAFLHAPPPRLSPLTQSALDDAHASGVDAAQVRRARSRSSCRSRRTAGRAPAQHAPVLTGTGALTDALLARVPFKLTRAQERVWREISRDLKRATPMQRLLAGRRRQRQDDRRGARRAAGDRNRPPGRVHGAHRNSRRAALPQARAWLDGLPVKIAWLSGGAAGEGSASGAGGDRERRGDVRDRHARAVPGRGRAAAAWASRSSTSSTASASRSASSCAARRSAKRTS